MNPKKPELEEIRVSQESEAREEPGQLRGLYRHVRISVKSLNIIIVVGIAALEVLIVWAAMNGGYTVTFDSNGGTDVAAQAAQNGDLVTEPSPPSREGYTFAGWYQDEACTIPWDFAAGRVESSVTLYAAWSAGSEPSEE